MSTRFASALLLSLTLASSSVLAQGGSRDDERRDRPSEYSQHDDRNSQRTSERRDDRNAQRTPDRRPDARQDNRQERASDHRNEHSGRQQSAREFHKGERLPAAYRDRAYVVDHWQDHQLKRPPHGQQWVQVGGDYVLVAVTTGIIASIILNH